MASSVYIETTVPSYLTARRSSITQVDAKHQITRHWWHTHRHQYDLFISDAVLLEASGGDPDAAQRRLAVLAGLPVLPPQSEADEIVATLVKRLSLPHRAITDAVHIALCIVHRVDFLLTWNCTHIANAAFQPIVADICEAAGYPKPIICTPEQLMGDRDET